MYSSRLSPYEPNSARKYLIEVQPHFIAASPHNYQDYINPLHTNCCPNFSDRPKFEPFSLNSLIAPNPHKMVQYLEPWQLFRESMKRTYYMRPAVFLGLSITDKIVSLAMSDSHYPNSHYSLPCHYGICPIDYKSILDKLLDCVLRLKINSQYDLLGIVVANRSSKENPLSLEIDDLMDHLCEIGRFTSLKYTRWEDDIASRSALFECCGSGWRTFPVDGSDSEVCSEQREDLEIFSARFMIGAFVNVFKTLHGAEYLRQKTRRGWILREGEKEAVQDVPQQSRAEPLHMFSLLNRVKDDRELDSDEEKEMEDSLSKSSF